MANPYIQYYQNQAGYGISGFAGVRYQRGRGFFTKLWSGAVLPLLKALGQNALSAGYDIARDAASGRDLRTAARHRLADAGANMLDAGVRRVRDYAQTGTGKKKKKKQKVNKNLKYTDFLI